MGRPLKILYLPDVQARPGDKFNFLRCIGLYIMDKRPDVIVVGGDFADMPSCGTHDRGRLAFEGRRYRADIAAAHEAMESLLGPMRELIMLHNVNDGEFDPMCVPLHYLKQRYGNYVAG